MKKTILTTSCLVFFGFVFGQTSVNTAGGEVKNSSDCPCENNAITECTEAQYQEARKTVFTILRY